MRDDSKLVVPPGQGLEQAAVHGVVALGVGGQHGEQASGARRRRQKEHQAKQPRPHLSTARLGLRPV